MVLTGLDAVEGNSLHGSLDPKEWSIVVIEADGLWLVRLQPHVDSR